MSPHGKAVCVTLTAHDEARNIGELIEAIRSQGYDCLVVDDGSSDATAQVARAHGARVVRHELNLGQGFAVLTGFKAALQGPCDIIIEMDADGQHDPAEISQFLDRMESSGADIVVGSRRLGTTHDSAPWARRKFLPLFTYIINKITGYSMTDAMCGFRAFRASSLARGQSELESILEGQYFAAEMFIRLSRVGLTVDEVPVHLRDRGSGHSSKGLLRYGLGVLKAIVRAVAHRNTNRGAL